jgi:hypothetical protein
MRCPHWRIPGATTRIALTNGAFSFSNPSFPIAWVPVRVSSCLKEFQISLWEILYLVLVNLSRHLDHYTTNVKKLVMRLLAFNIPSVFFGAWTSDGARDLKTLTKPVDIIQYA